MADNNQGGLFGRIRGNAEWEFIKFIGGSSVMTSVWQVCIASIHHVRPDWLMWDTVFGAGIALAGFGFWRQRRKLKGESLSTSETPPAASINSLAPQMPNKPDGMTSEQWKRHCESAAYLLPVQVETLRLAKELAEFLIRLGPEPTIDPELQKDKTYAGNERALIEMYARQSEWEPRFQGEYALSFRDRVTRIIHIFAVQGLHDERLTEIAKQEPVSDETVREIRSRLIALAMKIDDPPFPVSNFSEAGKMLWNLAGGPGYMESYNRNPQFRQAADLIATKVNNENRISRRPRSI